MARPSTVADVLSKLEAKANPKNVEAMATLGTSVEGWVGVSEPEMRKLAKEVGRDHRLAQLLWKTGIAEARIVAAFVDDPAAVTSAQMDRWVKDFDSWDVCDQACLILFDKSPLAWRKIPEWAIRNIGKRNPKLNRAAVKLAKDIQRMGSKAARWVAADAIRELQKDWVRSRLKD